MILISKKIELHQHSDLKGKSALVYNSKAVTLFLILHFLLSHTQMYCKAFFIGFRIQICVYSKKKKKKSQTEPSSFLRDAGKVVVLGHHLVKEKGTGTNANYFYLTIFVWVFFHMLNAN